MTPSANEVHAISANHPLWESVLSRLRMAILTGELPPHTHLVETELGESLHVSRGPIREALVRLQQEGLVVSFPYRGKFVADISESYIREVYELRSLLENHAMTVAIDKLRPEQLEQLQALLDQMIYEVKNAHYESFAASDLAFHREIVAASGSKLMLQMWETLTQVTHATIAINASSDPGMVSVITKGHQAIVDALAKHDVTAAQQAVTSHLQSSQDRILRTMHMHRVHALSDPAVATEVNGSP